MRAKRLTAASLGVVQRRCMHNDKNQGTNHLSNSLNLNLDLSRMDFTSIAKSTHAAIARDLELRKSALSGSPALDSFLGELDALNSGLKERRPQLQRFQSSPSLVLPGMPTEGSAEAINKDRHMRHPYGGGSHAAHHRSGNEGMARKSLQDILTECFMNGNWSKAMECFNGAIEKSRVAITQQETDSSKGTAITADDVLEKALDPKYASVGIGRWRGNHYRALLQCLFALEDPELLEEVWKKLVRLSVPEKRFDAFLYNAVIAMVLPSSTRVGRMAVQSHESLSTTGTETRREREGSLKVWKAAKRHVLLDIGALAARHNISLRQDNIQLLERARLAESIATGATDATTHSSSSPGETSSFVSADEFNKILAKATSDEVFDRILKKMEGLGVAWNDRTFAAVLRSIRRGFPPTPSETVVLEKEPLPAALDAPAESDRPEPKWTRALDILAKFNLTFPGRSLPATVANELLEFFKSRRRMEPLFYAIVSMMTSSPQELAPLVKALNQKPEEGGPADSAAAPTTSSPVAAITWTSQPNAKTYEILIRHNYHLGKGEECWFWFDEMRGRGIRGTGVAYHTMLDVAGICGRKQSEQKGTRRADRVLEVYAAMKEVGYDVTNLDTTVNLINAWSSKHVARQRLR